MTRLARESSVFHRLTELISNDCIFSAFLIHHSAPAGYFAGRRRDFALLEGVQQDVHKGTGGYKDQQDADDQAVQTGGFSQGAAQDQGGGNGGTAFRLAAYGFSGLGNGLAFADTGADARDQGDTRADGAATENDTNGDFKHGKTSSIMMWYAGNPL